ncbi:SusC/RagA family TonB-linked outer membrane protein [Paraflavisolibacter sp. H34]|uniref:SusC/RagA family TonB-linked outer membrane protein n=1 Tax=Huijunlia imazamoxiresistens TaxID=3127457 RepID=UPI0030159862
MWNYLKLWCIVWVAALCSLPAGAQNAGSVVVTGKVTGDNRQPLQGASVAEVDGDGRIVKSAASDIEGNFILKVTNPKHKISVSYVGFATRTQPIGARTSINFQMETGAVEQQEVVVIANRRVDNGMAGVAERNLTTAVERIGAEKMEEMQATSIDQALQGRIAGMDITASSGDPGAAMNIRIRGVSSINSNGNPLIVVDGMPFETEIPSDFNFGTADEQGYAQLLNISPADIKDISVLKDAAATAVWGSRAANGVLIITTKRGVVGRPGITYTFKGTVSKMPRPVPMLDGYQYATLIPEIYMNRNGSTLNSVNVREFNYDPNDPYWYYNYSNNVNWVDAVTRTGSLHDHTVSMTGGGEKAKYFASIGYNDNKGTVVGTAFKRINTRINLDYTISERMKVFTSIAYTHSDQDRMYISNNEGALRSVAYLKMPNMSIYEFDEQGNLTPNYFSPAANVQGQYSRMYNPVAMATEAKFNVLGERIVPRFQADYSIRKNVLRATFDVQFDINNTKNNSFLPQIATGRPNTETVVNRAYEGDIDLFAVTTKTSLAYTPRLKNTDHDFSAFFNAFTNDFRSVNQEMVTSNTASSLLVDPAAPSRTQNQELSAVSRVAQTRSVGAVVIARYGFRDKYLVEGTLRGDGSSRFGPDYRYGLFPGGSVRWRISGEKPLRKIKQLDDLSFRFSYAVSGNAPRADYGFYNTYTTYAKSYLGRNGTYPASMELRNFRWETVHGINTGLNISLFKGRYRAALDAYRNQTRDMFFNGLQIPSLTGFGSVNMNVGTLENRGVELAVWTTPYRNKVLSVGFDFNISRNENIIREVSELYPSMRGDMGANGNYLGLLQIDNPFGSIYGYKFKGVYPDKAATIATGSSGKPITRADGSVVYMRFNYPTVDYVFQPGDAIYEDINKDGNINSMDVVYLGNSNPKFSGGFGPSLTYKQFKLSSFFNFRYDYDVVNGTRMNTTRMSGYDNQSTEVLRRWRYEGDVTDVPRGIIGGGYNWLGSDRYVEDASFVRFRTVTARYTFAKKAAARLNMKNLSGYLTVENLFTWTKYSGQDPEVSSRGGDPFRVAADYSMTPPSKMVTLGIVAGF